MKKYLFLPLLVLLCHVIVFSQTSSPEFTVAPAKDNTSQNKGGKKIINNRATFLAAAEYPEEAARAGVIGSVEVEVLLDKDGKVIHARAISGHQLLRKSAEEAAKNSQFYPDRFAASWQQSSGIVIFDFVQPVSVAPTTNNFSIINGKAKKLVKPDYPESAREFQASGSVNVLVVVDEKGQVASATAISGHPLLKKAAEKAALKSKFTKTTVAGIPAKLTGIIIYNFIAPGRKIMPDLPNAFLKTPF